MAFLTIPLATTATASATTQSYLPITNLTSTTLSMTYEDILALPKTTVTADLACYGNPVASGDWGGVKLSDLLNQAGLDPATTSVDFKASDGYVVNIPLDMAMRSDVIVAYDLGGAPLPEGLRLVIPGENGNMWISMITSITMSTTALTQGVSSKSNINPSEQFQSSTTNITTQVSQPQQTQTQPTPSSNPATVEPTVPPANVTQPPSDQKVSGSVGSGLSLEAVWVFLGVSVAAVGVGFAVYRRKRLKV